MGKREEAAPVLIDGATYRAAIRAAMQAAADAASAPRPVVVPRWGTVYVRDVTVGEVDEAGALDDDADAKKTRLARAACRVICDENGERLFDATNPKDVALISSQPWAILQQVLTAADSNAGNA